jgi:hypothetical protein
MTPILLTKTVLATALTMGTSLSATTPLQPFEPHVVQGQLARPNPVGLVQSERHAVLHTMNLQRGTFCSITVKNAQFAPCLIIQDPSGQTIATIKTDAANQNAHYRLRVPKNGIYRVIVTSSRPRETGNYQVEIVDMRAGC